MRTASVGEEEMIDTYGIVFAMRFLYLLMPLQYCGKKWTLEMCKCMWPSRAGVNIVSVERILSLVLSSASEMIF